MACCINSEVTGMAIKPKMMKKGITKQSFDDVMGGLHAHTMGFDPEAQPYLLTVLEREYIAFALALYYRCPHCERHHKGKVNELRAKAALPERKWWKDVARAILFLRVEIANISDLEFEEWVETWRSFGSRVNAHSEHLPCYIAASIAISRDDDALNRLVGSRFVEIFTDPEDRESRAADILEVVSFMKGAVSKNRAEPKVMKFYRLRP
jgi:hypothetical protein